MIHCFSLMNILAVVYCKYFLQFNICYLILLMVKFLFLHGEVYNMLPHLFYFSSMDFAFSLKKVFYRHIMYDLTYIWNLKKLTP